VASQVETGMMFINNIDWSDAELPFGGIKYSGYGRELGDMGIQEFVNKKLVRTHDMARRHRRAGSPGRCCALCPTAVYRDRQRHARRFDPHLFHLRSETT
jgi:hypothetical protein